MSDQDLVPGDKIVDLAALLRTSATLAGAVIAAGSLWFLTHDAVWTAAAVLLGGAGGVGIGTVLGFLFFPSPGGHVWVVKVGPGAMRLAMKAGLIGGLATGILAGLVSALMVSQSSMLAPLAGFGAIAGAVIGATGAYIATRP